MNKQIAAMAALFSFWGCLCLAGCSTAGPIQREPEVKNDPVIVEQISESMPEARVLTKSDDEWKQMRLVSLAGNELKVRVYPVKSAELTRISVGDIAEIELQREGGKRSALTGFLIGMAPGAVLALLGSMDKKTGYVAVKTGWIASVSGGCIGLIIGANIRQGRKVTYDFRSMSDPEKIGILRKAMGI